MGAIGVGAGPGAEGAWDAFAEPIDVGRASGEPAIAEGAATVAGSATEANAAVDLPDPAVFARDAAALEQGLVEWHRLPGALFVDGVSAADARQGTIGDCYLVAAMAAVAHTSPATIEGLVKPLPGGTYEVAFHGRDPEGTAIRRRVEVDGDVLAQREGAAMRALYASSGDRTANGGAELWPAIVEKAYATLEGGYDAIGLGGNASAALEAMTGAKAELQPVGARLEPQEEDGIRRFASLLKADPEQSVAAARARKEAGADQAWTVLAEGAAKGLPMVAESYGDLAPAREGILPAHAYAVLGVEERNGERFVRLKNPLPPFADLPRPAGQDPAAGADAAAGAGGQIADLAALEGALTAMGKSFADLHAGAFEMPFEAFRSAIAVVHRAGTPPPAPAADR